MERSLIKFKGTGAYKIILPADFNAETMDDQSLFIEDWHSNAYKQDYCYIRHFIMQVVTTKGGFNSLTAIEKDIAMYYTKAVDPADGVPYLMGKHSIPQVNAEYMYLQARNLDIERAAKTYGVRVYSPLVRLSVLKYMDMAEAENAARIIYAYREQAARDAMLGKNYDGTLEGIMDYIEGTGINDPGLSAFFDMENPTEAALHALLVKELKDLIYYGFTT